MGRKYMSARCAQPVTSWHIAVNRKGAAKSRFTFRYATLLSLSLQLVFHQVLIVPILLSFSCSVPAKDSFVGTSLLDCGVL